MFQNDTIFDFLLEKATSHLLMEPDWVSTMEMCDLIRKNKIQPRYALASLKRELVKPYPHSVLHALLILECMVKNCGTVVHEELTSKRFCNFLHELCRTTTHNNVRCKLLELIQIWNFAFRENPKHGALKDLMDTMKLEGYEFPLLKESDAMFSSDMAPEWADGDVCHRCRVHSGIIQRKHCRACGQVFCGQLTSKTSTLPKYGIEKESRVLQESMATNLDANEAENSQPGLSPEQPRSSTHQAEHFTELRSPNSTRAVSEAKIKPSLFRNSETPIKISPTTRERRVENTGHAKNEKPDILMSAMDKLEMNSETATVNKEDQFDNFGKYLASLLRTLPINQASMLQQEMITRVLAFQPSDSG